MTPVERRSGQTRGVSRALLAVEMDSIRGDIPHQRSVTQLLMVIALIRPTEIDNPRQKSRPLTVRDPIGHCAFIQQRY